MTDIKLIIDVQGRKTFVTVPGGPTMEWKTAFIRNMTMNDFILSMKEETAMRNRKKHGRKLPGI